MSSSEEWYEVIEHKDYLYVIREKVDEIEPRLRTTYVNIYLLLGSEKALLIDTGCGIFPLKPIIDKIIGQRELLVFNTHCHFDHRGGNDEFPEVYIHESEKDVISVPEDISWLQYSSNEMVKNEYGKKDFKLKPSVTVKSIKEGDELDLGGITVKVIHTPGHSVGSISLFTDRGELFTGDLAHYGAMYLQQKSGVHVILDSLSKLMRIFETKKLKEIYPAHEDYSVGKELLVSLHKGISNLDQIWHTKMKDEFLQAWILDDQKFTYVIWIE